MTKIKVVDNFRKSVVKITNGSRMESRMRIGSGFVVQVAFDKIYIITATRIIEGDPNPSVEFFGNREFKAKVLSADGENIPDDVLPISLSEQNVRNLFLQLDKRDEVIFTFGFPRGGAELAYTEVSYSGQKGRSLLFSGNIYEGNVGSPLIKGNRVIGMIIRRGGFVEAISALAIREFIQGTIN